jgi:sulfotransferase
MKYKIFGISGLPRTGSTLLTCLLNQNPSIHSENSSSLNGIITHNNQLLHDQTVNLTRRIDLIESLLEQLPDVYYTDVKKPIIFDKNRAWIMGENYPLFKKYVNPEGKIIVLYRNLVEIAKSFWYILLKSGYSYKDAYDFMTYNLQESSNDGIFLSLSGVAYCKHNNTPNIMYLSYNELVNQTEESLNKIYDFCEIPRFQHDFDNIVNNYPDDDIFLGIPGMHDVRSKISVRDVSEFTLPKEFLFRSQELNKILELLNLG